MLSRSRRRFYLAVADETQVVEAGVYEGGRELWECAIDLVEWLAAHRRPSGAVLELGCGRGLPGLWCLKRGAHKWSSATTTPTCWSATRGVTRRGSAVKYFLRRRLARVAHGVA